MFFLLTVGETSGSYSKFQTENLYATKTSCKHPHYPNESCVYRGTHFLITTNP